MPVIEIKSEKSAELDRICAHLKCALGHDVSRTFALHWLITHVYRLIIAGELTQQRMAEQAAADGL